jgi:hypothetical protein
MRHETWRSEQEWSKEGSDQSRSGVRKEKIHGDQEWSKERKDT